MPIAPILAIDPENPQPRHIERAAAILENGGIIAYPTDTYLAIGCDLLNKRAVERLYRIKSRPLSKPLSFLCSDLSDVSHYAKVSNFSYRVMKRLIPGPYTFVLPATRLTPEIAMTRQKTVGIRVPAAAIPIALIDRLGHPLLSTSASFDDRILTHPHEIKEVLGHAIDLIIDGDEAQTEPSTVVSLVDERIDVLRQGKGRIDELG